MTKGPSAPPSSLQKWTPATERDVVTELERMAIHFPRTDMDSRKWKVLFQTFFGDMAGLSIDQIRAGCRKYRNDPNNKFFPTPGQLKQACGIDHETKFSRHYDPLPELPEALPPEVARVLIAKTRAKYDFPKGEKSLAALKEEILARPKIPFVPMTPERKNELLRHIKQNLEFKYGEGAAKYIAELPEHGPE